VVVGEVGGGRWWKVVGGVVNGGGRWWMLVASF